MIRHILTATTLIVATHLLAAEQRPNVLIIVADDLRPDCLLATGAKVARLPNLEALAARSCIFRDASLQGSTYPAVCVASRAMLLTGRGVSRLPVNHREIRAADFPSTLARAFGSAGYVTYHTGKNESCPVDLYREFHSSQTLGRSVETEAQHGADTAAFIREHSGQSWLAYVEFALPHDPQDAPESYHARFRAKDMETPIDFRAEHPFDNGEMRVRDELTLPRPLTLESVKGKRARYWASAAWMDHQLGAVLAAVRDSGQEGRTWVVVIGDNGLSLGDHGLLGKQNLYAFGGMHIPCLVAGPGVQPRLSSGLAQVHDIFPTLAAAAGLAPELSKDVEGVSLLPAVRGLSDQVRPVAFSRYRDVQFSAFDGRWKLIVYPRVARTQLFDRQADPYELRDLSETANATPERRRLEAELAGWRATLR
jgi:arylsulfatase A-like enzyme